MKSLIERAVADSETYHKQDKVIDDEGITLALMCARGAVTLSAVARALGKKNVSHAYIFMARALVQAIKSGRLIEIPKS